jgi:hypothetical protein
LRGASAIQKVLEQNRRKDVVVIVVWEPILPSDISPPGAAILARLSDLRAQQLYDPKHLIAGELAKTIAKYPQSPRPACCIRSGFYWDLIAVIPKGGLWGDALPAVEFIDGPVVDVEQGFSGRLSIKD